MKELTKVVAKAAAKAALSATTVGANSACTWHLHQAKFPEKAKQLKK